jgi:hypothetical protein
MSSVPASGVKSNDQRNARGMEGDPKGSNEVQVRLELAQRSVLAFLLSMSLSPALHRYPDWRVFDSPKVVVKAHVVPGNRAVSLMCDVRFRIGVPCILILHA